MVSRTFRGPWFGCSKVDYQILVLGMYVAGQSSFASVNISYHCLYVFRDIKHYQNNKDKYIVRIIYHFDQERLKLFAVLGFRVILIRLGFPFFFFWSLTV